jgi:hypothetical protein
LPRVSATPAANFVTSFTSVIDTVANNGNNIRLLRP